MDREEFFLRTTKVFQETLKITDVESLEKIHDQDGLSYDELYAIAEHCVEKGKRSISYFVGAAKHYSKNRYVTQKQSDDTRSNERNAADIAFNMMRNAKVPITLNISEEVYAYFEKAGKEMGVTTETAINLFLCSSVAKEQEA